jgi:outer membrane protein assembly factor BamD (BamD/ComL family)
VLVDASKNLPGPHLLLALVYERRGNWSEAMREYEWLMRTAPTAEWRQKALARIHGLLPSP